MEELTWGEAALVIQARRERERERLQSLSVVAWAQAAVTARCVLEGKQGEVYESFPFWSEEEVRALRVEKYRSVLERMAGQ